MAVEAAVTKAAEAAIPVLLRQFGYILHYNVNLKKIKKEVQKLKALKERVQHTAVVATRKGETIEQSVLDWLTDVDEIVDDANKLIQSKAREKAQFSWKHIPHLSTRYLLSKSICHKIKEISETLTEGKFDNGNISYRADSQVTYPPFSRDYVALNSRTSMLKEIMLTLKSPHFSIIGVHGMGGLGKTTVMKQLAWVAENDGSFDAVVVANITASPNVENIQNQIADSLKMEFTLKTTEGRAKQLWDVIKMKNSILIILDDVWRRLNLIEVGIPFGDAHKGCRLVVTSRDRGVLTREFGTKEEFPLTILDQEEKREMFQQIVGGIDQNIKPIAEEVTKLCAGLPILIDNVAKGLIKEDAPSWNDTCIRLKKFDKQGVHESIYSTFESSYDRLESDDLKSLFRFIGSFGLDYLYTGPLLICYWGLGLFTNCPTLADARVRFYKLINDLKAKSLLLESEIERVRIYDLVGEVAKLIASETRPTYGVKRYTKLKEWPKMDDELRKCHQIILPWSYICELPEKLECPELELLQLQNIGDYLEVPDNFFSEMIKLKVISLYGMMFTPSPPPSLECLTELKTLVLSGCVLEDISIVAKLESLEILRLERSDIKKLPKELGKLTNLRMLNLTNCSALSFIPANLISSLTRLEELYMGNCFIQWDVKGSDKASLEELRNLSHLTALDIMIQDASVWPRDLDFKKLERYNIFVGDTQKWSLDWSGNVSEPSKILKLEDNQRPSFLLDFGINSLLNSAEDMYLSKIHGVGNVLYELNRKGFPQLKHLSIEDSTELLYIINSTGRVRPDPALPMLETLALRNLSNLEKICHGPIPNGSFTKLRSFEVKGCEKLKNIFWCSLVKDLPQLHEIKVSDCKTITEIFIVETSEADKEIDKIIFPELRSLELECLPKLNDLCAPVRKFVSEALIYEKVVMPHLELLKLFKINSKKLWDDTPLGHSCIQNVKSLTIQECDKVANIFSSSVAKEIVNLKYLKISNCRALEEIFVSYGKSSSRVSNDQIILPNLETLEISHMIDLTSVWPNTLSPDSFSKLKQLKIESCSKLSIVFPSYVLDKLQKLETVTVTDCPALEVVFETQDLKAYGGRLDMQLKSLTLKNLPMLKHIWNGNPKESFKFQNICLLRVTECKDLNHVLPLSMAKELQHLQEIYIEECGIEMFAAPDELVDTDLILIFPELTSLSFRDLTQLQSFYRGLHTLDCPVLKYVDVLHCDKLVLFKPKSVNYPEIVPVETPPLLSIEKFVPNTRELILNRNDVTMLCNGQLNDELIYTVKALRLRCFHESYKFPPGFIQKFINLIKLKVTCSSFTCIFSSKSECAGHSETTMKLRNLVLVQLDKLKFIWEEKSEVKSVIQNIETLGVHRCSKLKNIVPSSVLFENLEQLEVANCGGLEYIMKSSTVANLPKLRKLCIDGCEKIEEIVATDDKNDDASELCFTKLGYLRLNNLPGLRSFCKGRHDFKFPLLRTLFVINCPMMKTFSNGKLNTPKLLEVRVTPQDGRWNGDLNTTIDKIALKRVMHTKLIISTHVSTFMACILTLLLLFLVYEYPEL